MTTIHNPWAKLGVDWDWHDHQVHGYLGGTDYRGTVGLNIIAPCDGYAFELNDGLNTVVINYDDDNDSVNLRELKSRVGKFPRNVKYGDVVGIGGRLGTKFLHVDASVAGTRVPFETIVTPTVTPAENGHPTPALPPEDNMITIIKTDPKGNFYRLGESTVAKLTQQEASDFKDANHGVGAAVVKGPAANRMFAVIDRVAAAQNKALIAQFIAAESD